MKLIWSLFLLMPLVSPLHAQDNGTLGAVTGQVVLADGKTPAKSATIMAIREVDEGGSYSAAGIDADAKGRFKISDLPLGTVSFWVAYPQYAPKRITLKLNKQKPRSHVTILLKERGGSITGTVSGEKDKPVSAMDVVAFPQSVLDPIADAHFFDLAVKGVLDGSEADVPNALQARTHTDASGKYRLTHLTPGKYIVLVGKGNSPPFILGKDTQILFIHRDVVITEGKDTRVNSGQVPTQIHTSNQPSLSVKCSHMGGFGGAKQWSLEVTADGTAHLSLYGYPKSKPRQWKITPAQFAELNRVMDTERFFELENEYGGQVPDSSTRTLSIVRGNDRKTVTLNFLRVEDPKLPQIKRAIRVWNTIRQWFDDAGARDLRPYDQRLLDSP